MIVRIDLGWLEINLTGKTISQADSEIHGLIRVRERAAFASMCAQVEQTALAERSCACGGTLAIKDGRPRTVSTLGGEVGIRVRRLRCPACGHQVRPLDRLLPPGRRHTLAVVEAGLFLATELSYAKASSALERLTGAKISHGQLQRLASAEGPLVGAALHQAAGDLYGLGLDPGEIITRTSDDTLVIAIDGGMIPDRVTRDCFEAKVAVLYGLKAQVSKDRVALVDRVGYAGLEDSVTFAKRVSCLALQHGMGSAGRVLAIGDGAGWIRRMIRDFLPGSVYLLDLFHLKRRLREVLPDERDAEVLERITAACIAGDPSEAIALLTSYKPPAIPERERDYRKLLYYIRSNAAGIANYTRSDLFGSGSVEKAVDLIVSRRFKCRGMSWLRPGAHGMLKLRLLRFNGEWDTHWASRMAAA
jgi:hypothetical protein